MERTAFQTRAVSPYHAKDSKPCRKQSIPCRSSGHANPPTTRTPVSTKSYRPSSFTVDPDIGRPRSRDASRPPVGGGLFYSDISRDCPSLEIRLERVEGVSQFTRYTTYATLTIPAAGDAESALTLLENAEHGCLVAKSLKGEMPCSSPSGAMPSWPSINPKPVLRKRSASPPWTTGGIVGINLAVRIFELTTNDG